MKLKDVINELLENNAEKENTDARPPPPPLPPPPASRVASHLTTDKPTAQVEAEVEAATNGGLMPVAPAPPNPGAVVWFTGVEGQEWPCKVVDTKGGVVRLDKFPLVPNAKPGSVKSKCVYANASQWVPWEDRGPQGAGAMGGSTLADAVAAADRHVRGIAEGPRNRKKLAALMCQPVVDIEFPHTNVVDIDDDLRAGGVAGSLAPESYTRARQTKKKRWLMRTPSIYT